MQRRTFLSLAAGACALAAVPASVRAEDFRKSKPTVWTAKTVDDALKAMYGTTATVAEGVTVVAPDVASNGGAVPVDVKSDIAAKSVMIVQNVNPESAVIVYDLNEYSIIDFSIKIKMKASGTITAIVQGNDGKLYSGSKTLDVALGGCEG
ncbi:thiosulfate oxidation carrier protein SoxY [Sulfurimonas sp. HSL-3221]|uniref:Thiosulfate oxidation carrier protein SoxY n=1 Tax=Sulfurimonas diazotrophicus TaxID=3131939 RepID=A0ABZ3H919_9BACT|nr:thiosulfate oxidation carrier protein SoxY [Sulfurimonas sp. HSL-3221]UFS62462.1 thiosulfate oxidation carrier protein SoxY [Sulfurimonas sp. HSL-3221]